MSVRLRYFWTLPLDNYISNPWWLIIWYVCDAVEIRMLFFLLLLKLDLLWWHLLPRFINRTHCLHVHCRVILDQHGCHNSHPSFMHGTHGPTRPRGNSLVFRVVTQLEHGTQFSTSESLAGRPEIVDHLLGQRRITRDGVGPVRPHPQHALLV